MKLKTLVSMVSSLVSKESNMSEVSNILNDICVYEDDWYLFFNDMGLKSELNEDLLNKNFRVAPYIIFEKRDNKWRAFEFNKKKKFLDDLIKNEFDNSIRIVFEKFDFNLVQGPKDISEWTDCFRNTLVVKGF